MRTLTCFSVTVFCCVLIIGCGDPNKPVASKSNSSNSSSTTSRPGSSNNSSPTGGGTTSGSQRMVGGQMRTLPTGMLTGGGGASSGSSSSESEPAEKAENSAPFTADAMSANGLFPQVPGSGNASASLGGALFPVESLNAQFTSAPTSTSSQPAGRQPPAASVNGVSNTVSVEGQNIGGGDSEDLMAKAVESFANHDENEAMQLLYAHLLSDSDALEKYSLKYFDGLKKSRVALRWGVGVTYNKPKGFDGRHPVIGDTGGADGAGASSGPGNTGLEGGSVRPPSGARGASNERPYRQIDSGRPDGFVIYYTGEYGEMFIDYVDKHRRKKNFGALLADIPLEKPRVETVAAAAAANAPLSPVEAAAARAARTRSRRRPPSSSVNGGGPGGGAGGGGIAGGPASQLAGGAPGGGATNTGGRTRAARTAPKKALARAMGTADSASPDAELTGSIVPGVMLVGLAKRPELIARAKRLDLDILVCFTVTVRKTRSSGKTSSMTNMKIINVRSDSNSEIYSGKQLKDTIVAEQKGDGRNPVKKIMESAFREISEQFFATDMPSELSPAYVEDHVNKLVAGENLAKLPIAVEIMNFHVMDLLDEEKTAEALDKLFGEDGVGDMLLSHDGSRRYAAIKGYIGQSNDDDDDDL